MPQTPQVDLKDGKDEYVFGRARTSDVMLMSMLASSSHFRIFRDPDAGGAAGGGAGGSVSSSDAAAQQQAEAVYIEDTSQNGTLVNGTKLTRSVRRVLRQGDQIDVVIIRGGPLLARTSRASSNVPSSKDAAKDAAKAAKEKKREPFASFLFTRGIDDRVRKLGFQPEEEFKRDYELLEEVGSGAYGRVHKCVQKSTGNTRAVKIMNKNQMQINKEFEASTLLDEAKIQAQLDHPGIARLHDVFETESTL